MVPKYVNSMSILYNPINLSNFVNIKFLMFIGFIFCGGGMKGGYLHYIKLKYEEIIKIIKLSFLKFALFIVLI